MRTTSTDLREIFASHESASKRLSDIGDSSSLFSYDTSASFNLGKEAAIADTSTTLLVSDTSDRTAKPAGKRTMVNERAPAKAPRPGSSDGEDVPAARHNMAPGLAEVRFGQTSMPQSPLHRSSSMASKESSVFYQPKSRPEHHRSNERSGKCHRVIVTSC